MKKFTLVTPKSKNNNAYFYHHITPNGKWLVYNAGGVGIGDGIEVLDNKVYIYNLSTYMLENGDFINAREDALSSSLTGINTPKQPKTKDGILITAIESKSKQNFGYAEYQSPVYYTGLYSYDIYKYDDNGQLDDKPLIKITYNKESITQVIRILSVSLDGRYIAYTKADYDTRHTFTNLYVKNLDSGQEILVSQKASNLEWAN